MQEEALHIEPDKSHGVIHIRGPMDIVHMKPAQEELQRALSSCGKGVSIDLSQVTRLDTAGALLLHSGLKPHSSSGTPPNLVHVRPEHKALLDLVERTKIEPPPRARKKAGHFRQAVTGLGRAAFELRQAAKEFIIFFGRSCIALAHAVAHPSRLRLPDITHQMEVIGINALPIIALVSFVISVVIAYQGQVQLKPLGAEQYTVNLIAISVLREMGVLLTAIMIAGRSGSAFTAEIGAMKIREETDALKTIGFDPFELLVLPRLIAMLIVLPLLAFFADFMGLFGGALISRSILDISLLQYLEQVRHAATWKDFFVGMIKSPVFAAIIALVGCMHGLKVSGSAESVGKETTASVVKSIFLVLMFDGLFSIYFQKVGI
jgi:phospholipid/cholesterol/gamma-HCH transport system permease protein